MELHNYLAFNKATPISAFEISNDHGMKVRLTNIGASITDIIVADKRGNFKNVVLKHEDLKEYLVNKNYLGATIGRFANRIANGSITIVDKSYSLSVNEKDANNHLHGGHEGFGRKLWQLKAMSSNSITFQYLSPDGEEGYPGNLHTTVEYKLHNDNSLFVHYHAVTDQPTIVNLTNHSYFNLSGGKGNILNHTLAIEALEYTPLDQRNLPFGYKNQ
jgi:aldose 1-epimerase